MIAVALFLLVGMAVAMFGAGGSFLAMPVLYYFAGVDAHQAVVMSLMVVMTASLLGFIQYRRIGIKVPASLWMMAVAGMIAAYFGGALTPYIPEQLLLAAYGVLLMVAGVSMSCPSKTRVSSRELSGDRPAKLIAVGSGVGLLTGALGAGGGFLILPALMLVSKMPMRIAVASSAFVVMMQSFAALFAHGETLMAIDFSLLAGVMLFTLTGLAAGFYLVQRLQMATLSMIFAWLLIVLAAVMLLYQIYTYAASEQMIVLFTLAMIFMVILLAATAYRSMHCLINAQQGR